MRCESGKDVVTVLNPDNAASIRVMIPMSVETQQTFQQQATAPAAGGVPLGAVLMLMAVMGWGFVGAIRCYARPAGGVASGLAAPSVAAIGLDGADGDKDQATDKIATARFYADQILPTTAGLVSSATRGADELFAIPASRL